MSYRIICKIRIVLMLLIILKSLYFGVFAQTFQPGKPRLDISGKAIEAHGGGILQVGAKYYWYGENHALGLGNKTVYHFRTTLVNP